MQCGVCEGPYSPTSDLTTFLSESAEFISNHQWVWDIQMTKYFQFQYWNRIPSEWQLPLLNLTNEQLNQLPYGFTKSDWPASLKSYVTSSCNCSLERALPHWVATRAVTMETSRKMTPKKKHEVSLMAGVVADVCHRTGCTLVLDIGSGLGYLGRVLRDLCGLMVVEIEREGDRVATARRRAADTGDTTVQIPDTVDSIDTDTQTPACSTVTPSDTTDSARQPEISTQYPGLHDTLVASGHVSMQLTITNSDQTRTKIAALLDYLKSHSDQQVKVCLVGLHCCGDLTPDIIRLFADHVHSDLCAMVVVGCCYHKMTTTNSSFTRFPMSAHLHCSPLRHKLNVFAMRLAAQEMRARWQCQSTREHSRHGNNVSYRAMVQAVCGDQLHQRQQFGAKKFDNFETYAKHIASQLDSHDLEEELIRYHSDHSQHIVFIEPFTALQVCMQGVMESLVVADRVVFLQERGLKPALVPLFNDLVSPRNIAIVTTLPGKNLL